jgi:hypothetical protein
MLDLERIAAPADDVVSLAEVKAHLAIDIDRWDGMLGAMIAAATQYLDGADGILRRALVSQQWLLYLDRFPCRPSGRIRSAPSSGHHHPHREDAIALPLPPLASVDSITYLDSNGTRQAVDPAVYQVLDGERATVQPARGQAWPSALCEPRSIQVTFTAGYGDATQLPMPLVQTVLLMVGDLFANREAQQIADSRVTVVENPTVKALLAPYRVLRI